MPLKTWVLGEEVLAADFNTYVQSQVVVQFANIAARDAWASPPVGAVCVTVDNGIVWVRKPKPAWVPQSYSKNGTAIALGGFNNGTSFPAPPEDLTFRLLSDPLIYDATGAKYDGLYTFSFIAAANTSASGAWVTYLQVANNANRSQVASCNMNFAIAGAVFSQRLSAGEKVSWQMLNTTGISFTNVTVNLTLGYTP